mgnify:CR=1 FL=1
MLTTVPTRIRKPRIDVILMLTPVICKSPKEPMRLNGMVVITMKENFGDSNCADSTTNTRNTATAIAWYKAANSSCIIRFMELTPLLMVPLKLGFMTSLSMADWTFPPV